MYFKSIKRAAPLEIPFEKGIVGLFEDAAAECKYILSTMVPKNKRF
jgi:hypothetical protein